MIHRQNNVLLTDSDGNPDFAASYTVLACPVGAVAAAASSGSTATVDAGHGFAAADKALIWDGTTATFVAEAVNAVTATTIVWSSATPTIAKTNLLVNLGPDSASGSTPAYDASPMAIYTDMDGGDAVTNSLLTCDTTGNYDYWTRGDGRNWELIRDTSGTVAGVVPGWSGVSGQLNPCDFGAKGDGATNDQPRLKVAVDAAANATMTFRGPSGDFYITATLLLPAACKAVNDANFKIVRNWDSAGNGVGASMIASETMGGGTFTANDDIWWQGGRIGTSSAGNHAGNVFAIYSKNGTIKDVVIEDWAEATNGGRAILAFGDNFTITNVNATSSVTTSGGTGGMAYGGGDGCAISNCHMVCADDAYQCTMWATGITANQAISNFSLTNCTGESTAARLFVCLTGNAATTSNITGVTVRNLVGKALDALVLVTHTHASSTGTISMVDIDGVIGDADSDNSGDQICVVDDITLGNRITDVRINGVQALATTDSTPQQGPVLFKYVTRGSFTNSTINCAASDAALDEAIVAIKSDYIDIMGNHVISPTVAPTGTFAAIQIGSGANEANYCKVIGNTIIGVNDGGIGVNLVEATGCVVSDNLIKIKSGATTPLGISDAGGTVEGNNVVVNNNLYDWLALEVADNAAPSGSLTASAIGQLNEGDTAYANNLGHDLVGFEVYVAGTTQTQAGGTFLRAKVCNVATVATAADAVTLPYAFHGRRIEIHNAGANSLQIFPANSDSIGSLGVNNSTNLTSANSPLILMAINVTQWINVNNATLT